MEPIPLCDLLQCRASRQHVLERGTVLVDVWWHNALKTPRNKPRLSPFAVIRQARDWSPRFLTRCPKQEYEHAWFAAEQIQAINISWRCTRDSSYYHQLKFEKGEEKQEAITLDSRYGRLHAIGRCQLHIQEPFTAVEVDFPQKVTDWCNTQRQSVGRDIYTGLAANAKLRQKQSAVDLWSGLSYDPSGDDRGAVCGYGNPPIPRPFLQIATLERSCQQSDRDRHRRILVGRLRQHR